MSNTNLLPIADVKQFITENGEVLTPRYFIGEPRDYRLDLGKGVLALSTGQQITKPGESFKILPIACRGLEDALFGQPEKKWFEVYFINGNNDIGVFLFHGFSVDNLSKATKELRYSQNQLCEVVWTIKLEQKVNKNSQKYYMADFNFEPVQENDLTTLKALQQNVVEKYFHVYRHDTRNAKTLYAENWTDGRVPTPKELEAGQEKAENITVAFSTPEEKAQGEKVRKTAKAA